MTENSNIVMNYTKHTCKEYITTLVPAFAEWFSK